MGIFVLNLIFAVTVADYADADPAVVKSGRVKKAVANAVEKEGNGCTLYRQGFSGVDFTWFHSQR